MNIRSVLYSWTDFQDNFKFYCYLFVTCSLRRTAGQTENQDHHRTRPAFRYSPAKMPKKQFACKECGKWFLYPCRLKIHPRAHSEPYICQICDRGFSQPWGLKTHMFVHSGERSFECDECGNWASSTGTTCASTSEPTSSRSRRHTSRICNSLGTTSVASLPEMTMMNRSAADCVIPICAVSGRKHVIFYIPMVDIDELMNPDAKVQFSC